MMMPSMGLLNFEDPSDLSSRSFLENWMRTAISDAHKVGDALAVLFIRLDNFEMVNELLGHAVGDEILRTSTQRILACSQDGGVVAHLGGGKFALMLTGLSSEDEARAVAAIAAEQMMAVLSLPVVSKMQEITLIPFIGIAICPVDADNVMEIFRHASMAMYQAKSIGTNGYKFFSPLMNVMAMRRFEMDSQLRHALGRMELELLYQPQVDSLGVVIGMEALLRWHNPVLGNVPPSEFIPLAEENGTILAIGEWVIKTACLQRKYWLDNNACADSCYIAVNVSPCQFRCPDFVRKITSIVHEVGILPQQINIELTEGMLVRDKVDVKQKLSELKALGFRISVDDFGTGYSSLAYLKHFPIDVLKIDRSFVQDIGTNRIDEAVSHTIIGLARNLGIKTVAEGVETITQVQFLQSHGCEAYQGSYFSEPVTALKMTSILQKGIFEWSANLHAEVPPEVLDFVDVSVSY